MSIFEFFYRYFLKPIEEMEGYNIVNTLVYSILFIIIVYFGYKIIRRINKKIDNFFLISIIPFTLFGILIRIQVDYGLLKPSFFTVTPGIWIISALIWLFFVILYKDFKTISLFGSLLTAYILLIYKPIIYNWTYILSFIAFLVLIIIFSLKNQFMFPPFLSQIMDALYSYIGIKYYNLRSEHVVESFFIELGVLEIFIAVKIILTLLILYIIAKSDVEKDLKMYLYTVLFFIGFVPASRNAFILSYIQ